MEKIGDICCGCELCSIMCPKQAIEFEKNLYGDLKPKILADKCVDCKLCEKVCPHLQIISSRKKYECFCAWGKDTELIKKSSSGGVFVEIAKKVLEENGFVCGSIIENDNNKFICKHILTSNVLDLKRMQGSKYVQSDIKEVLPKIKEALDFGGKVLFSGTPCQIVALKKFLKKDYSNLLTIDLVCHGTPNINIFNDYIKNIEHKKKCIVLDVVFRKASRNQNTSGFLTCKKSNGKIKILPFNETESSYYYMFEKGYMYNSACYSCIYASDKRPGDITIGDYWGVREDFSEIDFNHKYSCLIVNSDKGRDIVKSYCSNINLLPSSFEKIKKHNNQLNHHTIEPKDNFYIKKEYNSKGYSIVEKTYKKKVNYKSLMIKKIKRKIKEIIDFFK